MERNLEINFKNFDVIISSGYKAIYNLFSGEKDCYEVIFEERWTIVKLYTQKTISEPQKGIEPATFWWSVRLSFIPLKLYPSSHISKIINYIHRY